ncbi:MAG: D-Ala-D-Ala carboxypeptidase family metallohydrolase, partial [Gemmatimonadales bacterium]|nr:D-Ala-D-Ala carboxypeptidase family metallohydrolase [Gemmatimonadales bacterium]
MHQALIRRARRVAGAMALSAVTTLSVAALVGMSAPTRLDRGVAPPDSLPIDSVQPVLPEVFGRSGKLRAVQGRVDRLAALPVLGAVFEGADPGVGVHDPGFVTPDGEALYVLALIPFDTKRGASLNGYRVGFWPSEKGRRSSYDLPQGFIEVTRENAQTPVSAHFRLADFLTHDQANVWPKLLVVQPRLLDKLELVAAELEQLGKPSALKVMSGFRTPQYNACRRCGRARDSRHMYGDAADVYVDGNDDGVMDDLNGDGKLTVEDARFLGRVAEKVEYDHPDLMGGIGIYRQTGAH